MVVDVQSKLRLALGSVKDQASIGKAMIYRKDGYLSSIDIAVIHATGHDETPIDDKHLHEILFLVSNSPSSISIPYLSQKISNRLHKTKNHFVALKTLLLIHRLLRGGDRKFEQDLRKAHLSGHLQILYPRQYSFKVNHSDENSVSFLHNYAAFLEERMGWFINQAGKLEPNIYMSQGGSSMESCSKAKSCVYYVPIHKMRPQYDHNSIEMMFRRLPKFQFFLDKVLNCSSVLDIISPSDRLTRAAIHNILRESFQVYVNFCEGVAVLADSFFDFEDHAARILALDLLKKASRQSYELFEFFEKCKRIIGSTKNNKSILNYPTVQIITIDHVLVMEQFMNNSSITTNLCKESGTISSSTSCPISNNNLRQPTMLQATILDGKIGHEDDEAKKENTGGSLPTTSGATSKSARDYGFSPPISINIITWKFSLLYIYKERERLELRNSPLVKRAG
ncbi:AP180 N-terminal homology (ANTH) domain [Macleaya cordata]|uniref:AP180 N-terminal homology (ANTH) domain n=1 Tax=Macleaya cordata TaxID=56857 RepID=A0A200QRV0_MACCD|nr:AP180 N-terminal homology (ANTH) domain [Macleaya cordata]